MSTFLPPGIRSKYFAISKNVIQAGNHMINDLHQGSEFNVPPTVGFLHHYRAKCVGLRNGLELMPGIDPKPENCLKNPTKIDRTIYKYKERLLTNMNKVLLSLPQQCKLV